MCGAVLKSLFLFDTRCSLVRGIYVLPISGSGLYWKYCLEMVVIHSKSQSTVQSMSPLQSSPESSFYTYHTYLYLARAGPRAARPKARAGYIGSLRLARL